MRRRSFLGGMGAAGAAAGIAVATPIKALAEAGGFTFDAPKEVIADAIKPDVEPAKKLRIQLVEIVGARLEGDRLVGGSNRIVADLDPQELNLVGPLEPYIGATYQADQISWEITRAMTAWGVRVSCGEVAGIPWNKFAEFSTPPSLCAGNTLTVCYSIGVDADMINLSAKEKRRHYDAIFPDDCR